MLLARGLGYGREVTRFPYLVKIRRLLALIMLGGLAAGVLVAVGTHRAGYSDGWAALGQMVSWRRGS